MSRRTTLYFATDIHASNRCFKKFVNAARHYKADVLVLGGDVTGKAVVPIVLEGKSRGSARYMGGMVELATEAELSEFEARVSDAGSYPHRCSKEERDRLLADPAALDALFTALTVQRMREWVSWVDERLAGSSVRVFFNAGNDDSFAIDPIIDASSTMVRPEGKCVEIDEHCTMISTGFANQTPFSCPRDTSEKDLGARIQSMVDMVPDMNRCIFNLHCPPYQSQLDNAPRLGPDLQPQMTGFGIDMIPVGSKAVRAAIERWQPLLGLHGHIHESRGVSRIGKTPCLNPGSEYHEGVLRGGLVNLVAGALQSFTLTSG